MRRTIPLLPLLAALAALVGAVPVFATSAESEVAFTYGVRAFNHGELDEAIRLFREAVAADPDNREARDWLAFALRRQSTGEAVTAPGFAGLLALRDQPRFDVRVGAAFGQDSNPSLLPDGVIAQGAGLGTLADEVEDRVRNLDLRAAAYPLYGSGGSDPRSGWSLGLSVEAKLAEFQQLSFLDERQWSAAAQLAWGSDPLGYLTGPLGYTRVPFGNSRVSVLLQAGRSDVRLHGDPLATADAAALTLVFRETAATATQIELDFQSQKILDGRVEPDVWHMSASQLFFLGRRDRYLRLGALRGKENQGLDGDATSLGGTAELALPLADRWTLQLAASRLKENFERSNASFDDTTSRAAAALSWRWTNHLYLTGRASWADRNSDLVPPPSGSPLDFRDYRRTAASVGFQCIW